MSFWMASRMLFRPSMPSLFAAGETAGGNPAARSACELWAPGGMVAEASTRSIRASSESVLSVSRLPLGVGGGAAAAGTGGAVDVGEGD